MQRNPLTSLQPFFVYTSRPVGNILRWLFFCVAIGLVPIISIYMGAVIRDQSFSLEGTLARGQLFATSIALLGEAMVYLLTKSNFNNVIKQVVFTGCLLAFTGSAICLGVVATASNIQSSRVMQLSLFFFFMTLIIGSICKCTER